MAEESSKSLMLAFDCPFANLPDHLLVEIFVRVPIVEWGQLACVNSYFADVFREDCLWHAALIRCFPLAVRGQRWPGPIPRGVMSKRRFVALCMSKCIFPLDDEMCEIVGHAYLYLKEQLEISNMPPPSGILHGTIIDQFIACGKSSDKAHELASLIWCAVIDNLEESHHTILLLKRLALEGEVIAGIHLNYYIITRVVSICYSTNVDGYCRVFCLIHTPDHTKSSGRSWKGFLRIFETACNVRNTMIYWLVPNRSFSRYQRLG